MSVYDLSALTNPERECIERLSSDIEAALEKAHAYSQSKGIDDTLASSAFISALLVICASTAYLRFIEKEKDTLSLCFVRVATEAMYSVVSPGTAKAELN